MKIEKQEFKPITIVIETSQEAAFLWDAANLLYCNTSIGSEPEKFAKQIKETLSEYGK